MKNDKFLYLDLSFLDSFRLILELLCSIVKSSVKNELGLY